LLEFIKKLLHGRMAVRCFVELYSELHKDATSKLMLQTPWV